MALVLYDFEALEDDELTVKEDEKLTVLNDENEDWWKCCNLKGDEGLVPAAYLEVRLQVESLTPRRLTWTFLAFRSNPLVRLRSRGRRRCRCYERILSDREID